MRLSKSSSRAGSCIRLHEAGCESRIDLQEEKRHSRMGQALPGMLVF